MFAQEFIAVFTIGLGGVFMYIAVVQYNKRVLLNKSGVPTEGVVIRLEQDNDSTVYYPVIQFTTFNREIVVVRHNFGTQPASYHVGQKIQILYDPLVPKEFVIGTSNIDWDAFGFGFLGASLLSVGLYMCFEQYF
jgi:hypothetical protein